VLEDHLFPVPVGLPLERALALLELVFSGIEGADEDAHGAIGVRSSHWEPY
jgi:hypothetical protein